MRECGRDAGAVLLLRILRSLDREVENDGDHLRIDAAAGGQSDRT